VQLAQSSCRLVRTSSLGSRGILRNFFTMHSKRDPPVILADSGAPTGGGVGQSLRAGSLLIRNFTNVAGVSRNRQISLPRALPISTRQHRLTLRIGASLRSAEAARLSAGEIPPSAAHQPFAKRQLW